jgi:pimeloyl-ACP methyl ester carboxylesterase
VNFSGQRVDAGDRLYLAAGMPTLLLWGERDPIIPVEHGQRAQERMPASRLLTFPDAGHFPHIDDPPRLRLNGARVPRADRALLPHASGME